MSRDLENYRKPSARPATMSAKEFEKYQMEPAPKEHTLKRKRLKVKRVKPMWMVLARHLMMPSGILDFGSGDVKGMFDTFEEADKFARKLFDTTRDGVEQPIVWVLKCEKTYRDSAGGVVVVSKKEKVSVRVWLIMFGGVSHQL